MKSLVSLFIPLSALTLLAPPAALAQCCGGRRSCSPSSSSAAAVSFVQPEHKDHAQPDKHADHDDHAKHDAHAMHDDAEPLGDPFPLAKCPISHGKLGSMGDPVVKLYDGREVRFCCDKCPPGFEKNLEKNLAKLDEELVKDQLPHYALQTSVVSGKALPEKPVDWIYNNRLVRLADEAEKAEFKKEPARYMAALDKATMEKQIKDYPLTTCPVSDDKLDAMGKPKDVVIAGRLIRLCCPSCEKDVRKDPAKFIAMVDEARKAAPAKSTTPTPK